MTRDLESAIQEFLKLARAIQAQPLIEASEVIERLLNFYRDIRVEGAYLDQDGDALLFQWGVTNPLLVSEPTDLRPLGDNEIAFEPVEQRYLGFTREICAPGGSEKEKNSFEVIAVNLSLQLFYGPRNSAEDGSRMWANDPTEVEALMTDFYANPFVASLLSQPVIRFVATIGFWG